MKVSVPCRGLLFLNPPAGIRLPVRAGCLFAGQRKICVKKETALGHFFAQRPKKRASAQNHSIASRHLPNS